MAYLNFEFPTLGVGKIEVFFLWNMGKNLKYRVKQKNWNKRKNRENKFWRVMFGIDCIPEVSNKNSIDCDIVLICTYWIL